METKKVIEQKDRGDIEVRYDLDYHEIELEQDYPIGRNDLIYIENSKAREVALAICPELGEPTVKSDNTKVINNLQSQLAEKDKEIERLKDEKDEALRLLNDALKLIHSLPDLLHDSLGECSDGNDYEIISINGERWINHKVVGSGEPLKQWIKSEIDKSLNK